MKPERNAKLKNVLRSIEVLQPGRRLKQNPLSSHQPCCSTASSDVKNALNEPFGRTLIIPGALPLPSVNTVVPVFKATQLPESSAPAVKALSPFSSPALRSF